MTPPPAAPPSSPARATAAAATRRQRTGRACHPRLPRDGRGRGRRARPPGRGRRRRSDAEAAPRPSSPPSVAVGRQLPRAPSPVGAITRGTTNPNRLRRVDRWLCTVQAPLLRAAADPLVVDLGYGATPITAGAPPATVHRGRADGA